MHPTSSLFYNFCLKNDVFCFLCTILYLLILTFTLLDLVIFWLAMFFFTRMPLRFPNLLRTVSRNSQVEVYVIDHFLPDCPITVIFELIFSFESSQRYYIFNSMRPCNFFSLNSSFPMHKQILQLGHTGLNLKHLSVIQRAQLHCPPPPPTPMQ